MEENQNGGVLLQAFPGVFVRSRSKLSLHLDFWSTCSNVNLGCFWMGWELGLAVYVHL